MNGKDLTNNNAEAAHRRLKYALGVQYLTIWKLSDDLRTVQRLRDAYYVTLLDGHAPPQKLKTRRDADRRIFEAVLKFEDIDTIEY